MSKQKDGSSALPLLNSIADEVISMRDQASAEASRGTVVAEPLQRKSGSGTAQDPLMVDAERIEETTTNPATQVGRMPPQPATLRAKLGSVLVQVVRRALFWYSAQVNDVNVGIAQALRRHAERISDLTGSSSHTRSALATLSDELSHQTRVAFQERAELRKEIEAVMVRMRRQEQDGAAIRRMVEASLPQLRDLTEGLSSTGRNFTELSTSVGLLRERLHKMQAATSADVAATIESALEKERATYAQREMTREADRNALRADIERGLDTLRTVERLVQQTRVALQVQDGRIAMLLRERRVPGKNDSSALQQVPQEIPTTGELGSWYVEFENAFRGSRSEIKERVAAYLPRLEKNKIGMPQMPVLDLGCGRGEWLEVLAENSLIGIGVDSNEACIDECRGRGLTAELSDAIEYLRRKPSESQGGITAFHVVEHIPFGVIIELLDEALRTLKPGGILILETPNPGNLLVGSNTFYLDPTHIRPLPSDLLRFMIESRGFGHVEVIPLHPFPESFRLNDKANVAAALLNDLVYGARDYAVIAERP
jgi:2-polyprenyl-3-methyl-5-hydroxy-6-metoxy-1,4-benzoquinol methylase